MAFTEKDMQAQEEQLNALKDELSRLNQKFDAQLKGMGLTEDDLKQQEAMTPEVEALVAKAKEEAKRIVENAKRESETMIAELRAMKKAGGAQEHEIQKVKKQMEKAQDDEYESGYRWSRRFGKRRRCGQPRQREHQLHFRQAADGIGRVGQGSGHGSHFSDSGDATGAEESR